MTESLDIYAVALKMFGSLGLVLLIVFGFFYGLRRFVQRDMLGAKEKAIKLIATHHLGAKKNISIIKVPGTVLVVGVTSDRINLLTRLENEEFSHMPDVDENNFKENSFLSTFLKISSGGRKDSDVHE